MTIPEIIIGIAFLSAVIIGVVTCKYLLKKSAEADSDE